MDVPFATLFAQISLVLFHTLEAIVAGFDIDVEQLFDQHLGWDDVVANVINDQATLLTVALDRIMIRRRVLSRLARHALITTIALVLVRASQ